MTSQETPSEKAKRELATIRHMQRLLARSGHIITCMNCEHWSDGRLPLGAPKPVGCTKFGAVPPPDVIAFGCPEWDQVIPF